MNSPFRVLGSQLRAASEIWEKISEDRSPADRWLVHYYHQHRRKFGSRDRRFLSETIYACFRHKTFLKAWLQASSAPSDSYHFVLFAAASEGAVSQEAFCELFSDEQASATYQALGQRILPPSQNFDSEIEKLSLTYSVPIWLVQRWGQRFGEKEARSFLEALHQRPALIVRTNTLKISREKLLKLFSEKKWKASKTQSSSTGILFQERENLFDSEEFRAGFFEVQDEGSQRICLEMNPKPGEFVWDVCAGGGGKSLAMAALMQNKGRIVSTDIRVKKLDELKKRAKRAGVKNCLVVDMEHLDKVKEMKEGFDRILVDAPCSGSGTLRRNPDAKWKLQESDFKDFQKEQLVILEKALPYLKPSGTLYYVTCSTEAEENEEVMELFLKKHPELKKRGVSGSSDGFLRLYPHRDGTDGFFLGIAEK